MDSNRMLAHAQLLLARINRMRTTVRSFRNCLNEQYRLLHWQLMTHDGDDVDGLNALQLAWFRVRALEVAMKTFELGLVLQERDIHALFL